MGTGFLPTQLPDLAVWVRADSGITADGANAVEFWDFKNGLFRGVTRLGQGVLGNRPTLIENDPAYNNKATLSFDGGDYLDTPNFTAVLTQPTTIFAVGEFGIVPNEMMIDSTAGNRNVVYSGAGPQNRLFAGANLLGGVTDTNPHIYQGIFNGVTSEILVDGISEVIGDAGAENMPSVRIGTDVGLANFLNGKVAELIIVNTLLTAAEQAATCNFLKAYYAI